MKINTITCHNVYNVGASLQAYALLTYLKNLGHQVEIIDYQPAYLADRHKFFYVGNEKYRNNLILKIAYLLCKIPERIKYLPQKHVFNEFHKKNYILTKNMYRTNEDLKSSPPAADVYFAGSDQIWNTLFQNGKDPAFYLDFVSDKLAIKASYAASFATDSIIDEYKENVTKWLKNIDCISVRENTGLKILNDINIFDAQKVVDPVFLLDNKFWSDKCKNINFEKEYLLVYDFEHNSLLESMAKFISEKYDLEIWSVYDMKSSHKKLKNVGPIEFITYIKNAKFILSNSFHATAFSLIFNKEFFVTNRNENINTRMKDMLNDYKISNRLVESIDDIKDINPIDYENINKTMKDNIKKSKEYIDYVLEQAKKRRDKFE